MARSTETKRAAAEAKAPAKRPAAGRGTGAARASRSLERPAPAAVRAEELALGQAQANRRQPVGEHAPASEHATTVPAVAPVADAEIDASAGPAELAAPPPGPGPEQAPEAAAGSAGETDTGPLPGPVPAAQTPSAATSAPLPRRNLVKEALGLHQQVVAFAHQQAEFGLSARRAMLASRSVPELLFLQGAFVGRAVEHALAHTLELTRLSVRILRQGLRSDDLR
jgi:hypothetical protein